MKRLFYIILIISISAPSCQFEREVETNIKPIEPHLVLNSLLFTERDSSYFYLTKSRSAFYETDTTWWGMQKKDFEYIGDAKFQLQVNGTTFNLKYSLKDSAYIYPAKLSSDDNIEVMVNQKDGELKSKAILPFPPSVLSVDTSKIHKLVNNVENDYLQFEVKIKDYPGQSNYYRLLVNMKIPYYGWVGWWNSQQYYTDDPVLKNGMPSNVDDPDFNLIRFPENYLSIFRDMLFEGDEYTLTFYIDYPYELFSNNESGGFILIKLQSISEDLYNYYFSLQRNQYLGNEFNEPIVVFNNIEGGLGILGTCSETTVFNFDKK
ncbi:MAG: DUF4249 domain-containing protein [Prevotella sp.]|jgi:hypothetical protein|nr:DUF4249 domain-containing protein [Prevotella sp.]